MKRCYLDWKRTIFFKLEHLDIFNRFINVTFDESINDLNIRKSKLQLKDHVDEQNEDYFSKRSLDE